jgi:putative membrane protein
MAAERTLLAWVRTGLAMMGFGFVVARFGLFLKELAAATGEQVSGGRTMSLWIGVALVLAGVFVLVVSTIQHHRYTRALSRKEDVAPPGPWLAFALALVLSLLGVALAWYLITIR